MNIKSNIASLKFDDKKLKDTLKHLYKSDRALKLGILEGATNADTNANVAEYAFYNEFGATVKHPGTTKKETGTKIMYYRENKKGRLVFSKKEEATFSQEVSVEPYEINIPARPFLRTTVKEKADDWAKILADGLKGNVTKVGAVERALGQVGVKGQADIQQTIEANKFEANAQSTIDAKKKKGGKRGDIPLKDSMDMYNAIGFEVTNSRGKSL